MTARPVQAVFFWRADQTSAFKAVYGRISGPGGYTKDFHQPIGEQARALERAFGLNPGDETPITWQWPGGVDPHGKLHPAADYADNGRLNLRWHTDDPPAPWRLHPTPHVSTVETIEGTPGLKDTVAADAQLTNVQASGERPWFIAVRLFDEGAVLHPRVVLENPLPGREYASWSSLPEPVRAEMQALPDNRAGGFVEFGREQPLRASTIVKRILEALKSNPNVLLVGPPGTGKTIAMEDLHDLFENGGTAPTFDPDLPHGAFAETGILTDGDPRVRSVVFHPSYTYEDFVIGLLPEPVSGSGGGVTVKPHVGPLLDLASYASVEGRRALLLCDEFNRGAAAAIFGDTLALLDRDKRSTPGAPDTGHSIVTPYRHLSPTTQDGSELDDLTRLPSTLYIVAAMNSADRSVAPLDAALRRRFSILFVEPDLELLAEHLGAAENFDPDPTSWNTVEDVMALAVAVLGSINRRVAAVAGRDFLIGHSVFWHVNGDTRDEALRSLAHAIDTEVMGTLTLSFTDNDAALAGVLNVQPSNELADVTGVAAATWEEPDPAVLHIAQPHLKPTRLADMDTGDLIAVLASLL